MANLIDLESKSKLSHYSNFKTRSLNVLELIETIFGPVPINLVKNEPSLINENWPRFNVISDDKFNVNSALVPRILSGVNVQPTGVLKLFCEHPNLTWEHVKNIPSRPLSNITKDPQIPSMPLHVIVQKLSKPIWTSGTVYHDIVLLIK